jgi:hypothetical protein
VDTFDTRVARLEEQIVKPDPPTAEECLDRAEYYLAKGQLEFAEFWLDTAKWTNRQAERLLTLDEVETLLDELDREECAARLAAPMYTYALHLQDGSDAGTATYAGVVQAGEEILVGDGRRFRVIDVLPFDDEDESPFVGLLQVEAAP